MNLTPSPTEAELAVDSKGLALSESEAGPAADGVSCEPGFLLTRQWFDSYPPRQAEAEGPGRDKIVRNKGRKPRALQLHFWFTTAKGPTKVCIEGQSAVCFVRANQQEEAYKLLQRELGFNVGSKHFEPLWQIKPLGLKDFEQQPLVGVYFREQRALYRARQGARRVGLDLLEADVRPTDRYLMERFITGPVNIEGRWHERDGFWEVSQARLSPAAYQPSYRVMSLDIETSMEGEALYCIGAQLANTDASEITQERVFMLRSEAPVVEQAPNYLVYCDTETALLESFLEWFNDADTDIIIGWNVINFDLRFLQRKADALGVALSLGRDRRRIDWRQSMDDDDHYTLTVPGRLVLDGIDTLKSATYSFESFSLDYVGHALLERGKLNFDVPGFEVEHRGEEISAQFHSDQLALAAYNLQDCQLVWDIFQHTKLFDFAVERAALTGLSMDRFGGSVAAFDNRYLPRLHRAGYAAPSLKLSPEGVGSPGGYVMDSIPGLYQHVLVLDFKSLYPSIIRTFSIDPLARVQAIADEAQQAVVREALRDREETLDVDRQHYVPGFNGALFSKQGALLPNIINELWAARDVAKRENNAAMSQAIKIIMNSFYGVLGTPGCRFFDYRLPSSITLRGHQILNKSKDLIEAQGHQVIYGDTDSVFVCLKNLDDKTSNREVDRLGRALAAELNDWWDEHLRSAYHLDSGLEIEFETHYRQFVMPTIRGADTGSKKRYAGIAVPVNDRSDSDAGELIFKGLEAVRTDWTLLARRLQRELYKRVFAGESLDSIKAYLLLLIEQVRKGERDAELFYRKRIRRRLDEYHRNVPPHVQAARKADAQREAKGLSPRYARGGWIEYVLTNAGPEPLVGATTALDYELYIERQIEPIVDGIMMFRGTSFAELTDQQLGLF